VSVRRGDRRGNSRRGGRSEVLGGPVNTTPPSIAGTPLIGSTLTATAGTWEGSPTITGQWRRDNVAIAGETGTT
jgi:hypothetical protein